MPPPHCASVLQLPVCNVACLWPIRHPSVDRCHQLSPADAVPSAPFPALLTRTLDSHLCCTP